MSLTEEQREAFLTTNEPRRVLVNSIPKSGTTWVRTMMAALPGYEEHPMNGVAARDPQSLRELKRGYVFHGHLSPSAEVFDVIAELDIRTVFVYRDLRDVIVSNYFHLTELNPDRAPDWMQGKTKEELFHADVLREWCVPVKRYPQIREWEANPGIPTVRYEELKLDTAGAMRRVLSEMSFNVTPGIVEHVVETASFERLSGRRPGEEDPSSPQRKGIVGDWRNHFSERNKRALKERYGELLVEFDYETDHDW